MYMPSYPMQLCVTLLVKMVYVSQMIHVAALRATLVKYVMSLLWAIVPKIFVRMEEHASASMLQHLSAHVLIVTLDYCAKHQVCHLMYRLKCINFDGVSPQLLHWTTLIINSIPELQLEIHTQRT